MNQGFFCQFLAKDVSEITEVVPVFLCLRCCFGRLGRIEKEWVFADFLADK